MHRPRDTLGITLDGAEYQTIGKEVKKHEKVSRSNRFTAYVGNPRMGRD